MTPKLDQACPVCAGSLKLRRYDWYFVCEQCALQGSNLAPDIPSIATESVIDEADRLEGLVSVRDLNNTFILKTLKDHAPTEARLLDVGSGLGFFLEAANRAGFKATGVEPDANVVETARGKGQTVRHGYFPDCLMSEEKFNIIVFNDVLEHIPDAKRAVQAAYDHLQPNGLLVLNCPSRNGAIYWVAVWLDRFGIAGPFKRMWQFGTPSPHRWYFKLDDLFAVGAVLGLSKVTTVDLKTVSYHGLYQRISYMKHQSKAFNILAFIAVSLSIPVLSILPKDLAVAIMKKES